MKAYIEDDLEVYVNNNKDKRIAEMEAEKEQLKKDCDTIAGDCIAVRTENEQLKAELSTEYMRGIKYAIYEIMKEADIRGSQEIRDSGDTDDEMCAAVAVKIREAIDDAVDDAIQWGLQLAMFN